MGKYRPLVVALAIAVCAIVGMSIPVYAMDVCPSEQSITYSWPLAADSIGYMTEISVNEGAWDLLNAAQTETSVIYLRSPEDITLSFRVTNITICGAAAPTYADVINVLPDPTPVSAVSIVTGGDS